ncbi:lectin-like [Labeo rohita]|uniref:lectin-like n=1 Tax=Labeo rohita TaxID=84645 RepID=UPI0021E2A0EE|nr:lectin-like [Labeo rohita]
MIDVKSGRIAMFKSRSTSFLLMTLLFGSGNFLTMEKGFVAGCTNDSEWCPMPEPCNVFGFTDWYKVGKHCVKYFNKLLNFTDAEFSCRKTAPGAHLVSVHSEEHNDYLLRIVKKLNPNDLRFWLGGFEFFETGKFSWTDGSFWDFQIWTRGEPSIYTSAEECVEMNWKEIGRWNDDDCYAKKNYMCAFKRNGIVKPG